MDKKKLDPNKYILGIDLGVASCGWSLIDPQDLTKTVDHGVYLFSQAQSAADRRSARSVRRRYNRLKYRKKRLKKLLNSKNIDVNPTTDSNLLDKRIKGLNEKLTLLDIVNILYFFIQNRGYIPFKEGKDSVEYPEECSLIENKDKMPCEIQKIILENKGKYRGTTNKFQWSDYKKEIKKILETQKQFYDFIDDNFIYEYLRIYESKRKFWEGPGGTNNIHEVSPYGRYRNAKDLEEYAKDNNYRKYLYEDLIADCSVYAGEKAAPKTNIYAQYFNLLNDLINITFNTIPKKNAQYVYQYKKGVIKLNQDGIDAIVDKILENIKKGSKINFNTIFKNIFSVDLKTDVSGYRIESKKPKITNLGFFSSVINLKKDKLWKDSEELTRFQEYLFNNVDQYNKIAYCLQVFPGIDEKVIKLKEILKDDFSDDFIKELAKIDVDPEYKKYHSMSEKALLVYINIMKKHLINSSSASREFEHEIKATSRQNLINNYPKNGKISTKLIDNLIANGQVKKSLRKAIYIINTLMEKYPNKIGTIAIESNKDVLNNKAKKLYEEQMAENQTKRTNAIKSLTTRGITDISNANIIKEMLFQETNGHCIYCGCPVTYDNMQIDHIIPISISADDSFTNKVCSCNKCNNDKGNRVPLAFITDTESFSERIKKLNLSETKVQNLFFSDDINKYQKRFINRNLRDTAYATNELMNQILIYTGANQIDDLSVVSVPPVITSSLRNKYKLEKDRDFPYHHAVDATLIASYMLSALGSLTYDINVNPSSYWKQEFLIENLTSDKKEEKKQLNLYINNNIVKFIKSINYSNTRIKKENNIKSNGQLYNANIVKYLQKPNQFYKINMIQNIYTNDFENKSKYQDFIKKINKIFKKEDLMLLYKKDKPTVELLKKVFVEYKDRCIITNNGKEEYINPFVHYCLDEYNISLEEFNYHIHGIRLQRKNINKQPILVKLQYLSKVSEPYLLDKKDINKKENTLIGYDSLSQLYTEVYFGENLKGKKQYFFLPIYRAYAKFDKEKNKFVIDKKNRFFKQMYDNFIIKKKANVDSLKFKFILSNNDYVKLSKKDSDEIYYGFVKGFHKRDNFIQIKNIQDIDELCFYCSDTNIQKIGYGKLGLYMDWMDA